MNGQAVDDLSTIQTIHAIRSGREKILSVGLSGTIASMTRPSGVSRGLSGAPLVCSSPANHGSISPWAVLWRVIGAPAHPWRQSHGKGVVPLEAQRGRELARFWFCARYSARSCASGAGVQLVKD